MLEMALVVEDEILIRMVIADYLRDCRYKVVEVSNAGAPIPPELVATLFNPFKRASLNNPRNRTGMGLGLYIAQQIVREHHGDLAYRHDGNEVIFSVRLPLL